MSNPSYEERIKAKLSDEDWEKIAEDADTVLVARLLMELKEVADRHEEILAHLLDKPFLLPLR